MKIVLSTAVVLSLTTPSLAFAPVTTSSSSAVASALSNQRTSTASHVCSANCPCGAQPHVCSANCPCKARSHVCSANCSCGQRLSSFLPASLLNDYEEDAEVKTQAPSRTRKVLKHAARIAGAVGTVALATTAGPGAALASTTAEAIQTTRDTRKIIGGILAAGAVAGVAKNTLWRKPTEISSAVLDQIRQAFPGALPNQVLVEQVSNLLETTHGFGSTSLCATSLCCDEVSRPLELDFSQVYTDSFNMGGLAGFPFVGTVGFGAMASHIPDGGSCLIVYGPHVGVDSTGAVGTTERRGRRSGGACCGSAIAAANYVESVSKGEMAPRPYPPQQPIDASQTFVQQMLMPHAERLEKAKSKMQELPYALYDAQKEMIEKIVADGCGAVSGSGKIAVLGGIQVNTPPGESDYYLPLSFDIYNNKGAKIDSLSLA